MKIKLTVLAAFMAALLSGCAAEIKNVEHPEEAIPDRSAAISAGKTTRAEARAALGEPAISSDAARFDLFRQGTEQSATLLAVTPIPVPIGCITDELLRYTLVAYDGAGVAAGVDSGIFRRPSDWRNISPIDRDFTSIHLRAGEALFFADPERARRENILLAPGGRDALLALPVGPEGCAVVLACGRNGCPDMVAVDAEKPKSLPLRIVMLYWLRQKGGGLWLAGLEEPNPEEKYAWLDALYELRLQPGGRTLTFLSRHFSGQGTKEIDCRSGERLYLTIDATFEKDWWNGRLKDWSFAESRTLPAQFSRRPLVLVADGEWGGPPTAR